MNLATADSITYASWLTGNWNRLIQEGNEALAQGIDFYYLRYRLGVAWFEKGDYHRAIHHFEHAWAANPYDIILQEYLYYAYLFAGRHAEARILAASFPEELKVKTQAGNPKWLSRVDVFVNFNRAQTASLTDNYPVQTIPALDGSQFISQGHDYYYLGLRHEMGARLAIYHAYSALDKKQFIFSRSGETSVALPESDSRLRQYYLALGLRAAKNLETLAGFHWVNIRYSLLTGVDVSESDYVLFAGLQKRLSHLTLGGAFYYGTLNNQQQYQKDLKLVYYPYGNNRLYTVTLLSHQTETGSARVARNTWVLDQQAGLRITPFLWAEAYATFGDMENFLMNEGAVVFNGLDVVRRRYGARLLAYPGRRLGISLDYTWFQNQSAYVPAEIPGEFYNTIKFTNQSITAGLSWNL